MISLCGWNSAILPSAAAIGLSMPYLIHTGICVESGLLLRITSNQAERNWFGMILEIVRDG